MPRIYYPFPAKVYGIDDRGEAFEVDATVGNMSARGLYLRLSWEVKVGAKISIIVRLSTKALDTGQGPQVKIDGEVIRLEEKYSDACGIGVRFERYRFL